MVPLVIFQNIWEIICVFAVTWKVPEKMCKELLRVGASIECSGWAGRETDFPLYTCRGHVDKVEDVLVSPILFGFWLLVSAYLNSILRVGLSALVCLDERQDPCPQPEASEARRLPSWMLAAWGGSPWPLSPLKPLPRTWKLELLMRQPGSWFHQAEEATGVQGWQPGPWLSCGMTW